MPEMKILGIETSCDETAAAVVEDGRKILSSVVASQIDIHAEFGGVVPEVAARSHVEVIIPVTAKAVRDAKITWDDIDAIAVTYGPGLPGALLVGVTTARGLALAKAKPLYGVDHVEAHMYANWLLDGKPPAFPVLALIVSGGHTQLVLFRGHGKYELLGATLDDAAGEAFDKVAKVLGLGFPGGPALAKAAESGKPNKYTFPEAKLTNPYDFSFSGLKTAVLRHLQQQVGKGYDFPSTKIAPLLNKQQINDTAASFQVNVVKTMVDKTKLAFDKFNPKSVVIAGGVAANQALREELAKALPIKIDYPPINLCTDNAAMIAAAAFFTKPSADPLTLETAPSLAM